MPAHRRYTKAEKMEAVAEVERTSLTAAAEAKAIPITTLAYWVDHEDFVDVRMKTRESIAQGSLVLALLSQGELARRVRSGEISDQALVATYGVSIDKLQLLLGAATSRTETRDLTGTLSDIDLVVALREAERLAAGEGDQEAIEGASAGEL